MNNESLMEIAGIELQICYGTMGGSNNVYSELEMIHLRQRCFLQDLALKKLLEDID